MSPEQAAGRLADLGPRSDVYSLGATLYAILTGKPPFDGDSSQVMDDVREGALTSPRQFDRRVPRPLNAICLKAMATRPSDRYASCAELSDELEAWLADAPVRAYRSLAYRVRLKIKRHRTAAVTASLLLTVLLLAGAFLARRSNRLNGEIGHQLQLADLLVASSDLDRGRATARVYRRLPASC